MTIGEDIPLAKMSTIGQTTSSRTRMRKKTMKATTRMTTKTLMRALMRSMRKQKRNRRGRIESERERTSEGEMASTRRIKTQRKPTWALQQESRGGESSTMTMNSETPLDLTISHLYFFPFPLLSFSFACTIFVVPAYRPLLQFDTPPSPKNV